MSISILVERAAGGYRATTGGPLDLVAEGETASDAVTALRAKISDRIQGGAVLIEQPVAPASPVPVTPLAANPLFDSWLRAVEEYRDRRGEEERAGAG